MPIFHSICETVFFHAGAQPDKFCLADESTHVSYREYTERICRTAEALKGLGVEKESTVVCEASQSIDFMSLELALQLLGAIFVPVERGCAHEKIAYFCQSCSATLAVLNKDSDLMPCNTVTMQALSEKAGSCGEYHPTEMPRGDAVSEILFSTGTTGREKGIVLTNENDIALAENVIDGVKMLPDNVELIPSPMNHSHGLRRYYANMLNGSSVVLFTGVMNLQGFFSLLDKYSVNSMDLVPTALSVILKLSKGKLADYADRLRYVQFGAAPLMQADKDEVKKLLPRTRLYNIYGSTESGCIAVYDFNDGKDKKGCIGRPAVNAKIVIVDADRNEIRSDKEHTGRLASFGRMNMKEYYRDEEETARAAADGFVYSNDEAYYDEDGDIILLGRIGDVINVGGNKVSPDEIENIAKKHPMVEDCGCIPVPCPIKGQAPKLFIKVAAGHSFDEKELRSFIAANTEPYKVPKFIIETDTIERTYNGKLIRRALFDK